jgi:hypothetical protein
MLDTGQRPCMLLNNPASHSHLPGLAPSFSRYCCRKQRVQGHKGGLGVQQYLSKAQVTYSLQSHMSHCKTHTFIWLGP